jgi:hypothetical protein
MATNVAVGKGSAGTVAAVDGATTVVDAGGATVDTTAGELSLWPGVEEHAASATTRATTMTLPDLMVMSPTFPVVDSSAGHVSPSAGMDLDGLHDGCRCLDHPPEVADSPG